MRAPRFLLAGTLLLGLVACSDPVTVESLVGEYNLVGADGKTLPATIVTADTLTLTEATGGGLTLLANQQYSLTVDYRITDPNLPGSPLTQRFIDVGPWDIVEGFLVLESTTPGVSWLGDIDGTTLTVGIGEPDFLPRRLDFTYRKVSGG